MSKSENTIIDTNKHTEPVLQLGKKKVDRSNKSKLGNTNTLTDLKGLCFRCGGRFHKANSCKFAGETCRKCGTVGHLSRVCRKARLNGENNQIEEILENENLQEINILSAKSNDKFKVDIKLEGHSMTMELDTGAALSSISLKEYKRLGIKNKLHKITVIMRTYTGEIIVPTGVAIVHCIYKENTFLGKIYVIDRDVDAICGWEWIREMKIDWAEIKLVDSVNVTHRLEQLMTRFQELFQKGIGLIPDEKACLRLKENSKPVFCKPRQVPYALKDRVEMELDRLEKLNIISKVDEWGTPIVPVVKKPNGSLRICADFKVTVNQQIKDERYPIPRIEDIFSKMNGGKYFCTLDVSNAYLHMPMDDESALIQTLSTHKGLYKVNRLMFGVKVAPALWNRCMDRLLQFLEGVHCFFDDIIIQGRAYDETLERLQEVFKRLKDKNLRLNRDKCKFFQESITYLGHKIDFNGLHKIKEKVEAVVNTKKPRNITQLRTFLGFANYYNKFIPNLATLLSPLYELLQKNKKYIWTKECEKSFQSIKNEIISDRVLVHFDPNLPLVLATDASPVGLGAVLSHKMNDDSDHLPVVIAFNETPAVSPIIPRLIKRKIDWELFKKELDTRLLIPNQYTRTEDIDKALQELTEAIVESTESATIKSFKDPRVKRLYKQTPKYI